MRFGDDLRITLFLIVIEHIRQIIADRLPFRVGQYVECRLIDLSVNPVILPGNKSTSANQQVDAELFENVIEAFSQTIEFIKRLIDQTRSFFAILLFNNLKDGTLFMRALSNHTACHSFPSLGCESLTPGLLDILVQGRFGDMHHLAGLPES